LYTVTAVDKNRVLLFDLLLYSIFRLADTEDAGLVA
jgi:hypothetical protein